MNKRTFYSLILSLSLAGALPLLSSADEGMYLFSNPPLRQVKERYGIDLSQQWLDHAMHAAVRFNNGGSGGFISPDGLVITNHHIADEFLAKLSTPDNDLIANGFLAKDRSQELKAPGLELNCLQNIEDVTELVNNGIAEGDSFAEANKKRSANIEKIEREASQKSGLRCDVVTLYQGGQYHLYKYKKYTDVRLVWAPEQDAAFFGGDADNFEYPRTSLDAAMFRVYENGKPLNSQNYFKISPEGTSENEAVFVIGHPGRTNRLETLAQVEYTRDRILPYRLARCRTMEAAYLQFAERSAENARRANNNIRSVANTRKASTGMFQGLCSKEIMERKAAQEKSLRDRVSDQTPWQTIASAYQDFDTNYDACMLLENADAFPSPLFSMARHIVRLAQEREDKKYHLKEYAPNKLESLKLRLFADSPMYADVEKTALNAGFSFLAERLGPDSPDAALVLQGKTPLDRAAELVDNCTLFDPAVRRRVAEMSLADLEKYQDPMIRLALTVDARSRELRKVFEDQLSAPSTAAYAQISRERFAIEKDSVPPDATFTLRMSYGKVKGYQNDGREEPWRTTIGDMFTRAAEHKNIAPYNLPQSWQKAENRLNKDLPIVFVATSDTIGGNSGSPVINKDGLMVGLNFDRNQFGMVRNFVYDEQKARHISVSAPAIVEALEKIYGADSLVKEIRR
ncbi:S46 family peptidase [bacterium]|nr:S46 family peptidase [bacterium]